MNVYTIDFNTNSFKIEADYVEVLFNTMDEQYVKLCQLARAEGLDEVEYNDEIVILVDDRGYEKYHNPVFEVIAEDGTVFHIAGKLLFVRHEDEEEQSNYGSVTIDEVYFLRNNLQIIFKGILKETL